MARRRRRVTVIRRNSAARRHQPAQDMPEVIERNPEYIEQGLRLTTTLEQRSLDSSEVAICFALIFFHGVLENHTRKLED
ncbi:hypothetical protein ALC53_08755 [Atta colombica]|uniref:Uncharacterized protein n=1 Tax=Atta colombica TaxID=520822 RepID=A0A195B987_9HYME|nr:hypothetical protein ALC53_08755 [Atta colombica]